MTAAIKVPTIFTAVDKYSPIIEKMQNKTASFTDKAQAGYARLERNMRNIGAKAQNVAIKAGIGAVAIVGPMMLAANAAIKFEDRLADIAKTTGLVGKSLEDYGASLLKISTTSRTKIDDLLTIGEIGGQLGIAQKDLVSFTEASNRFAVALGSDYGGTEEAITSVGKIQSLFKETRGLDVASSITKVGSAINVLGGIGSGTSANINDFILRIGALPDALKPSLQSTAALGAFFEEAGIDSQIASGGLSNFFLTAGKSIPDFAKQMDIGANAARSLLSTNPEAFASKFATSIAKLSPDRLALKLKDLNIGSQETIKVLGALGVGQARLATLQEGSANAFSDGASLLSEYNTKNNTTAASIQKMNNNFQALAITIGTEILPMVNEMLPTIIETARGFGDWVKENKDLVSVLLKAGAGIAIFLGTVSLVSSIVAGITTVIGAWAIANTFLATSIGLPLAPLLVLVGIVAAIIIYWDEWGASVNAFIAIFMPGLSLIIGLVMSFRDNWEMISKAFTEGGIIDGLLAIGATLYDVILKPLQQILSIIGKVTGFDWASDAASSINSFREGMGLNVEGDIPKPALTPPWQKQQELLKSDYSYSGNLAIDINDPGKNVKSTSTSGPLVSTVKIGSTQGKR